MTVVEVIDTNVVLVANGQHLDVSHECVAVCAQRLQSLMDGKRLALDGEFLILSEYQNKCQAKAGRGPGDAFVKWALQNRSNSSRIDLVEIQPHSQRGFESFPCHIDLEKFDAADRKFVAVAIAHEKCPPIIQAADSKWLGWAKPLLECGVRVEFICKGDIEKFRDRKAKG